MKKSLRVLATLSILASSILFAQPASAIGILYSTETGSGDVACSTSGWITIENNAVVPGANNCQGTVVIPIGVTRIGQRAFQENPASEVIIPLTVTSIDFYAFAYSRINSIVIPNSVTSIGNNVFERADNLTFAMISGSVTDMGRELFKGDDSLTNVIFGNGITTIPAGTFHTARYLTSVTIPSTVTHIGDNAFWNTYSLSSITIPNGVTHIGGNAFAQAYGGGLTSVTIPDSVIDIGVNAFGGADRLTTVTLGTGLTAIRAATFQYTRTLASITIPNSVQWIGGGAFEATPSSLTYRYCGDALTPQALANVLGDRTNTCAPSTASITTGEVADSKVATFTSGIRVAEIPVSRTLPAIKLEFAVSGGVVPPSVRVRPTTNPAPLSATPFMTTGSPRIVEIEVPAGHDGSNVKICLDGASTDNLYHYTGVLWEELPSRTYENNQVCGITNSFSPFVAAPVNPVTAPGAPTIGTATATGTTTATISFSAPASDGGSTITKYTATSNPGAITAEISQAGSGTISVTGLSAATSYTFTVTATNSAGTSVASTASNSVTTFATGIAPLFLSASSYDGRFTVQIKDYDEAFTYTVTASEGTVSVNATGLITVNGLRPDQSVTVNVTTTRAGFASGTGSITGRSQVAPMLPGTRPTLTITDTLITCTIGSYSATPSSSAFSLLVDGKHVSTIFSAVGESLPDWIIPWATSSSITRTASLTSATWAMSDSYQDKSITCTTLAYSKHAIGLTSSQKAMIK